MIHYVWSIKSIQSHGDCKLQASCKATDKNPLRQLDAEGKLDADVNVTSWSHSSAMAEAGIGQDSQ